VSPIAITFDLWTDSVGRHFVGVIAHYFDRKQALKNAALCLLELTAQRDTGESVAAAVRGRLVELYGADVLNEVKYSVVDNGGNCVSAARILTPDNARRCLQHGLQLFFKWFTCSNKSIATALAVCNYIARTTKMRYVVVLTPS
jgi:hypothetical protein